MNVVLNSTYLTKNNNNMCLTVTTLIGKEVNKQWISSKIWNFLCFPMNSIAINYVNCNTNNEMNPHSISIVQYHEPLHDIHETPLNLRMRWWWLMWWLYKVTQSINKTILRNHIFQHITWVRSMSQLILNCDGVV